MSETLAELILSRCKSSPDKTALSWIEDGQLKRMSFGEFAQRFDAMAAGLLQLEGVDGGSTVTILGDTSVSWILCDAAALSVGLVTVPVYASLLPEEVGYAHADTKAVVAIVENAAQFEKVKRAQAGFTFFDKTYTPQDIAVQHIVVIDPEGMDPGDWISLDDLEAQGAQALGELPARREKALSKITADTVATYTYTSGTTGPPKATIQSHRNLICVLDGVKDFGIFGHPEVEEGGMFLFLPLAHSFGRLIEFACFHYGVPIALAGIPTLADDLKTIRPGFVPAAPRVFEKIKAKLDSAVQTAPPMRQKLFAWAISVGLQTLEHRKDGMNIPAFLQFKLRIADKLVLSKVRARLGLDRCRAMLTGSAPISEEVHAYFLALGLNVLEAYGLTETCPGLTINRPWKFRVGSVGQTLPTVTLQIADDGEILAKGDNVISGYLNRPEATAAAFDAEGWFHTGDLGRIDGQGFLYLTGRKKELIKTSGGKYVAPAKIEGRIKNDPLVGECIVVGDRRKYCVALVSIDPDVLPEWAARTGCEPQLDAPEVAKHIDGVIDEVNQGLASFESIKYCRVLPQTPTVENGLLTASLKVKRHVVEETYAELIDAMFDMFPRGS